MYTDEHRSFDLGQDPETFRGDDMWDVAAKAGKRVGVFGPMQSWPCREYSSGGFYVPDTFARSPETVPASLARFQAFNLSMTAQNSFSSDSALSGKQLLAVGGDLLRLGFTPRSALRILKHLIRERLDARHKAARPMMQVLPTFDLFWRLHTRTRPDLSIFFTNHVAGMMHRYWGDSMPGYQEDYARDPVFSRFVISSMDLFDAQLGQMERYAQRNPETVIVVASSMGQGPIEYRALDETYVVEDSMRLGSRLKLGEAKPGLAMYPRTSLQFADGSSAEQASRTLGSVETPSGPLFNDIRVEGSTLSFEVNLGGAVRGKKLSRLLSVLTNSGERVELPMEEAGIAIKKRLGGGNTAYHIPEGILIIDDPSLPVTDMRPEVDLLDVAPYLLRLIGCEPGPSMRGDAAGLSKALGRPEAL